MSDVINAVTLSVNEILKVKEYMTADRKRFTDKDEAIKHAKKLDVKNQLMSLFEGMNSANRSFTFDSFISVVIENAEDVRDCLSKYIAKTKTRRKEIVEA